MHQEQGAEVLCAEPGLYLEGSDSEKKLQIAAGWYEWSSEVATIFYVKEMIAIAFVLKCP